MLYRVAKHRLLETVNRHPIDAVVIYSKGSHWWSRLFHPLSHVSLLIRQGQQHIWFEPSIGFSEIILLPEGTKWRACFDDDAVVQPVRLWRDIKRYRCPHLLQPFTCVEQVKAFLGIRKWWILTPKQLRKYLDEQSL